jgi:hypothetical protein
MARKPEPSWPASLNLTNDLARGIELGRVVAVNHWAKLVGLLLVTVTLIVVVVPDFDLPPTLARASSATQKTPLAAFSLIIANIKLLLRDLVGPPVRVFPGSRDFSASLIDLNCTRLC